VVNETISKNFELLPICIAVPAKLQGQKFGRPLQVLLDSGSTTTWFNSKSLPQGIRGYTVDQISGSTLAGSFTSSEQVCVEDLVLPEFHPKQSLPKLGANIFNSECRYDMILGRDILRAFSVILDFEDNCILSDGVRIPMKPYSVSSPESLLQDFLLQDIAEHLSDKDENYLFSDDGFVQEILDSKYDAMDPKAVADSCTHLSENQRADLAQLFSKFTKLFDGKLRHFTDERVHLDIDETITPKRSRAYAVPHMHKTLFKRELDRLVQIDVLEKTGRANWVSGTFIVPKKDGRVRWVSDFRALNKAIRRKYYPLPKINEILSRRKSYKFLSKMDLSMQYYTFLLDNESSELCTIATPFGLYKYKRLPMGVSTSPDIAQEIMERILGHLEDLEIYIDDLAAFSNTWKEHIKLLDKILTILQDKGFSVNPLKCEWGIQETDFLGHWLTPTGIKPWKKKIDAILRMQPPTNIKELRSFLGMVTYYRDMWPHRAHVLSPLTDLIKSKFFRWGPSQQKAFDAMRSILSTDVMLAFPDHNLGFDIETDASDYQLGAVIKQLGRPVAYYSRKLTAAQKNYSTIEKELLSVLETLRTFRSMLLGARLTVHTDHKNLTHKLSSFTTQRVMRWRLLLEEFGPEFAYKKGKDNCIADALSRVPTINENEKPAMPETRCVKVDDLWTECLWAMPKFDEQNRLPFQFEVLALYQSKHPLLYDLPKDFPGEYSLKEFGNTKLVCKMSDDKGWIVLTDEILPLLVNWYHEVTVHAEGMDRLESTIRRHFWHPKLRETIRSHVENCSVCKEMRKAHPSHGQLAPRIVPSAPWTEVHVDLIGPWEWMKSKIRAMTMIDPVTNLVEIVRVSSTKSDENARAFANTWLSRYPMPERVVSDGGPEFVGSEWEFMLMSRGIKRVRISAHTPTANSVIESSHKAMGQILRTLLQEHKPSNRSELDQVVEQALARTMYAMRCSSSTSLMGASPGALVFGRDMHLNVPFVTDIVSITENRQLQTDARLKRENLRRSHHDYQIGENVYVLNHFSSSDKLKPVYKGPYKVVRVHTNGTLTIERGQIHERISIRRLKPEKLHNAVPAT